MKRSDFVERLYKHADELLTRSFDDPVYVHTVFKEAAERMEYLERLWEIAEQLEGVIYPHTRLERLLLMKLQDCLADLEEQYGWDRA